MPNIEIECKSCSGTGLFKGMAERGASAVVCYTCKGTGKTTFEYTEFTGRKERIGVSRVFDGSHGYCLTSDDIRTEDGKLIRFSQFGCTYDEWKAGKTPIPIKDLYCPYIANNRGIGNEPLDRCKRNCKGFGSISNCQVYDDKQTCWELYDAIHKND